jgi:hypothetical protein
MTTADQVTAVQGILAVMFLVAVFALIADYIE